MGPTLCLDRGLPRCAAWQSLHSSVAGDQRFRENGPRKRFWVVNQQVFDDLYISIEPPESPELVFYKMCFSLSLIFIFLMIFKQSQIESTRTLRDMQTCHFKMDHKPISGPPRSHFSGWVWKCLESGSESYPNCQVLCPQQVSRHVVQFSWGRGDFTDRIYFTHFRDKNTRQPMLSRWMESVDFVSTDDFGKHVTTHVPRGNKFVVSEQFTLVAQCLDPQSQNVQLMVRKHSTANRDQPFEKAFIPTNLAEKSYAVLDASEGFVLLHVNHGEGLGNVYVSDDTGTRYVLLLAAQHRREWEGCFWKGLKFERWGWANTCEHD